MNYRETTQLPNALVDAHLKNLSEKELKILLLIIRQTIGFSDGHGGRKKKEWLSQKFISNRTGLSCKSISLGIHQLINKKLVIATNKKGAILNEPEERKGCLRIFYASTYFQEKSNVKLSKNPITKSNTIKLTTKKLSNSKIQKNKNSKLTDWERYCYLTGQSIN
ncbi:replication protein [Olleya sp. UBA1516]|uniref:replication protein n=1 Tax=Olleya sp. UBA1516 TaxID=1947013 RepID=UPI0025F6B93F|nr:replication protein [Olleya sp. UBA1516]|tara:strand:- start:3272 stop:3766 length:495 start_codon:yes stop_codon:yes gene_type:complete